jgi:hypothetical protein
VLIYGDFDPPETDIDYPQLRIVVEKEKQEGTVIRSARTVVQARVVVDERSIPALRRGCSKNESLRLRCQPRE